MQGSSFEQLPLGIKLRDSASFNNFYTAKETEVVESLRSLVEEGSSHRLCCLWGPPGSGKTHLLQAVCRYAADLDVRSLYIPLKELKLSPSAVQNTGLAKLVCIDDINRVSGDPAWERALFNLYESLMQTSGRLVFAANTPPKHLKLSMPDLSTRLASQLVYRLPKLDDYGKCQAMQLRASARGFKISDEVAKYVLRHYSRNTAKLFELLDQIDRTSLAAQRRVTIPLVKDLIEDLLKRCESNEEA